MTDLLFSNTTYQIRGACFNIYKTLGSLHKESVYQKALAQEFTKRGIKFEREKDIVVDYDGEKIGNYRADFIVENNIVIETKATKFNTITFEKQLFYYLASTNYKIGFLINFGTENGVYIKRWYISQIKRKASQN